MRLRSPRPVVEALILSLTGHKNLSSHFNIHNNLLTIPQINSLLKPWNSKRCFHPTSRDYKSLGSILNYGGCFYRNAQFMRGGNKNRGCIIYFDLINSPNSPQRSFLYDTRKNVCHSQPVTEHVRSSPRVVDCCAFNWVVVGKNLASHFYAVKDSIFVDYIISCPRLNTGWMPIFFYWMIETFLGTI